MKRRQVQRLVREHFAPSFPELTMTGDLLARWDGDPILRGFLFERHDEYVRLFAFAQPLFVPLDNLVLNVAEDLGDYWFDGAAGEAELAAQMRTKAEGEGRAFLERVSDCVTLADTVAALPGHEMDPIHASEIRAYTLLWNGRSAQAAAALDELVERLREFDDDAELETLTHATQVREALARSESEARALLEGWASATAKALKLG